MAHKNLLTVLKAGDETHYLVRNFLQSLPDEAKKVFNSLGYVGDLKGNLRTMRREDMRHFVIFRSPGFEDLVTEYFSSTPQAALSEIPDRLTVKVDYKQQDTDFAKGARLVSNFDGSIDQMVEKYRELSSTNPTKLLTDGLNQSEFLRENMTKKGLFGFGKTKIVPTYVSVGIETPDGRYLLGTTGAQGPYVGKFGK
ncbi:MAG: hypothetical protein U9Q69_02530 [Nanoarchaeota archaeon]|nr:hypothetical protein [Nanoarchaeota archaeon]